MSEPVPKNPADASKAFSFFQSEVEPFADELDTDEIALSEILAEPLPPTPPRFDSDKDCACE